MKTRRAFPQRLPVTRKPAEHHRGTTGLARSLDYGRGPVPEESDNSTYYSDVIRWLVAHPGKDQEGFLLKGAEHPDAGQAVRLKETSCDVQASVVCVAIHRYLWRAKQGVFADSAPASLARRNLSSRGFLAAWERSVAGATHQPVRSVAADPKLINLKLRAKRNL
jgi:hypothetical protein